jgi:hypothetical protein
MAPKEAVLAGTVQNLVLVACEQLGVAVKREFPQWSQAATWQGACITCISMHVN